MTVGIIFLDQIYIREGMVEVTEQFIKVTGLIVSDTCSNVPRLQARWLGCKGVGDNY